MPANGRSEPSPSPCEKYPHDVCGCDLADDPLCQCQGCGAWRSIAWLGKAHACWRNEDGTYEEGGTFQ